MNDERNPDRQPDSTDHQPVEGSDAPESTSVDWQKPETWPAETGVSVALSRPATVTGRATAAAPIFECSLPVHLNMVHCGDLVQRPSNGYLGGNNSKLSCIWRVA